MAKAQRKYVSDSFWVKRQYILGRVCFKNKSGRMAPQPYAGAAQLQDKEFIFGVYDFRQMRSRQNNRSFYPKYSLMPVKQEYKRFLQAQSEAPEVVIYGETIPRKLLQVEYLKVDEVIYLRDISPEELPAELKRITNVTQPRKRISLDV